MKSKTNNYHDSEEVETLNKKKFTSEKLLGEPDKLTVRAMVMQLTMSIIANITIISSGIGIGFTAITLFTLTKPNDPMALTEEEASWFAAVITLTCPFGALAAGYLLEKLGRKTTLYLINVISIISWIILYCSSATDKNLLFIELIVARIIIGFAIGMSSSPASVYSAEISHPDIRGRLTVLTAFFTAFGILLIYVLGYIIPDDFRTISLISGIFTIFSFATLFPLPESPTWLVGRHRYADAEKTLRIVRGVRKHEPTPDEIYYEITQLKQNLVNSRLQAKKNVFQVLLKPEIYKPLLIMVIFFLFQQFSGCFVVMVYGAKFASEAGVTIDPILCVVFIGLTRVVTTILMGFISDRFGRRPPAMVSAIGMALSMYTLALYHWLPEKDSFNFAPGALLILYMFFATLGLLTLPFAMIAEVFPQRYRGFGAGLTIFGGYAMAFVCIKLYPTMHYEMGNIYLSIFYGSVALTGWLFVYFILPETKGKTLAEIEDSFRGGVIKRDIEMQDK